MPEDRATSTLLEVATELAEIHGSAVDGEWGCCHLSTTATTDLPEGCDLREIREEWLPRLEAAAAVSDRQAAADERARIAAKIHDLPHREIDGRTGRTAVYLDDVLDLLGNP